MMLCFKNITRYYAACVRDNAGYKREGLERFNTLFAHCRLQHNSKYAGLFGLIYILVN
jgi:hypothetical protein